MTQRALFERTDRRDAAAVATLLRTLADDIERAAAFDFLAGADEPAAAPHARDDAAPASQATFEVYRDNADEWRWRLRHDNGNIIADSGEGYTRRRNARNGLESVARNAPGADVDVGD